MRSRFQPFRISRKCWSCSLFMYASPRLVMYGVTLRGPASRLPASRVSSPSPSAGGAVRAAVASPLAAEGTPFAVTTMRSAGGDLRMACATGVELAAALTLATGAGFATEAGLAAAVAGLATAAAGLETGALAVLLAATVFVAGFFAVNLGFSAFFGFAGFAAARLVGIVCRSRPGSDGGPVCR